jgi:hypothetical protein
MRGPFRPELQEDAHTENVAIPAFSVTLIFSGKNGRNNRAPSIKKREGCVLWGCADIPPKNSSSGPKIFVRRRRALAAATIAAAVIMAADRKKKT